MFRVNHSSFSVFENINSHRREFCSVEKAKKFFGIFESAVKAWKVLGFVLLRLFNIAIVAPKVALKHQSK